MKQLSVFEQLEEHISKYIYHTTFGCHHGYRAPIFSYHEILRIMDENPQYENLFYRIYVQKEVVEFENKTKKEPK